MSDVFDQSDLIVEALKATRVDERMQRKIVMLREEFVNKSIDEDFRVD